MMIALADRPSIPFSKLALMLNHSCSWRQVAAGEFLYHKGDPVTSIYVLESGRVRLSSHNCEDRMVYLATAEAGHSVGEADLLIEVHSCDAIADQPTQVRIYPKHQVISHLHRHPDLATALIAALSERIQQLKTRLELHSIRSARSRVLEYLISQLPPGDTQIHLDQSLKSLAHDLGLSHEVLYRTLTRLEQEGVITRSRRQIELHQSEANLS